MDSIQTWVTFEDSFMREPRMEGYLDTVPRQGDEIIIKTNVFRVKRVITNYIRHFGEDDETIRPAAKVTIERTRSIGSDGW